MLLAVVLLVAQASALGAQGFDNSLYDDVVKTYVTERGVDYARLKADRSALDQYVARLGGVTQEQFDIWPRAEKLAYLVNAYNALVLKSVIDHYPIKRSLNPAALVRPANSVWQVSGFFGGIEHRVAGRQLTLDDIEHKILRPVFKEPRIHVALVCAARSCPPLRPEAYTAERIDAQLDDQARLFFADRERNRFDRKRGEVKLSEIFKWFGEDFGEKEKGVLAFASRYVDPATQEWLRGGKNRITYFDYDWTLNDASAR